MATRTPCKLYCIGRFFESLVVLFGGLVGMIRSVGFQAITKFLLETIYLKTIYLKGVNVLNQGPIVTNGEGEGLKLLAFIHIIALAIQVLPEYRSI